MHLLVLFIVCLGLFLLFPKGFKFLVGSWVGVFTGGFCWCLASMISHTLITPATFVAFIAVGAFFGCVFAAKG